MPKVLRIRRELGLSRAAMKTDAHASLVNRKAMARGFTADQAHQCPRLVCALAGEIQPRSVHRHCSRLQAANLHAFFVLGGIALPRIALGGSPIGLAPSPRITF